MKGKRTIFVIDDDTEDQELFSEVVTTIDQSINCINPNDGKEALDLLLKEKAVLPEYIFVDLNMPVMNGYEFLKQVKKHDSLNQIPIIIYTTSSATKDIEEAIKLGATSFITKPTNVSELKQKLEAVFSSHYR